MIVETPADELDGTPGNGQCSLREAITNANKDNGDQADCPPGSGADRIKLPSGIYILTGAPEDDNNLSGDLDIRDALTLDGAGASTTIIQAGTNTTDGVDRVLHTITSGIVEISGVTIRYGKTPDGADGASGYDCSGDHGGGIFNSQGTLILNDCMVRDNRTGDGGDGCTSASVLYGAGGDGGGIYAQGTLELNNTRVRDNRTGTGGAGTAGSASRAGGKGGGIFTIGVVTLTDSVVDYNLTGAGGRGANTSSGDGGSGGYGGSGGGIFVWSASLTLVDSSVSRNTTGAGGDGGNAASGNGGDGGASGDAAGIYVLGGLTVATGSVISGNETGLGGNGGSGSGVDGADGYRGSGGGFNSNNASNVTLGDSTIGDNRGAIGGGLYSSGSGTVATLDNCTLSGNLAEDDGGGIRIGSGATLVMTNSTLSGNRAYRSGGGIYDTGEAVTLSYVTITDNTADLDNDGSGDGGGVATFGTFTMTNTLVADNIDKSGEDPDCRGTVISGDYNLLGIGDSAECTFSAQPHDQLGTAASPLDPFLSILGDWGGPTWTHALDPSSPAVDQIPDGVNGCVLGSRDQRGEVRFPPCDIGAFDIDEEEHVWLPVIMRQ